METAKQVPKTVGHFFGKIGSSIERGVNKVKASGEMHVPVPVDYVTWTEQVAGFAQRDDLGTAPKVLLHTGQLSAAAAAGLKAAGWQTVVIAYP
ncbi:MAG: hypothetical protein NTV46_09240 [Verrucomicrobia bacterium]|nr:hypothetical protein [Verrucomicrobiota bacterium]